MKRTLLSAVLLLFLSGMVYAQQTKTKQNYVIGFYNLENLFDIYDDPAKNDEQFLPEGSNKWTETKYRHKLKNMAHVIAEMSRSNGRWHTILGISEIENRLVIEDLLAEPELAGSNYQIVHYDGPDRRGVDVALLYRPENFKLLASESIPFTFYSDEQLKYQMDQEGKDAFRTRGGQGDQVKNAVCIPPEYRRDAFC